MSSNSRPKNRNSLRLISLLFGTVLLFPGGAAPVEMAAEETVGLGATLACLEGKSAALVSAHRGGPAPGYPENALETLVHNHGFGIRLFEIDIAESRDGMLFLLHDATLERTSSGEGPVAGTDWDEIASLRLEDNDGRRTDFRPPLLSQVLKWALDSDSFLALDFKGEVSIDEVMDEVASAGAGRNVMYLANEVARARAILARDPAAIVSVSAGRYEPGELIGTGLPPRQVVVWAGFREFDPSRIAAFDEAGFYVNFGTLGFGDSYDDRIAASGDESRYAGFAAAGLHVISSDRPLAARGALKTAGMARDSEPACLP